MSYQIHNGETNTANLTYDGFIYSFDLILMRQSVLNK